MVGAGVVMRADTDEARRGRIMRAVYEMRGDKSLLFLHALLKRLSERGQKTWEREFVNFLNKEACWHRARPIPGRKIGRIGDADIRALLEECCCFLVEIKGDALSGVLEFIEKVRSSKGKRWLEKTSEFLCRRSCWPTKSKFPAVTRHLRIVFGPGESIKETGAILITVEGLGLKEEDLGVSAIDERIAEFGLSLFPPSRFRLFEDDIKLAPLLAALSSAPQSKEGARRISADDLVIAKSDTFIIEGDSSWPDKRRALAIKRDGRKDYSLAKMLVGELRLGGDDVLLLFGWRYRTQEKKTRKAK